MAMRYYPALIYTQPDGFGVVFPDLPGCISVGDTVQHAAEMAAEALALHVEGAVEDGVALPAPSSPDVTPDWLAEFSDSEAARVLVPVEMLGKAARDQLRQAAGQKSSDGIR